MNAKTVLEEAEVSERHSNSGPAWGEVVRGYHLKTERIMDVAMTLDGSSGVEG